MGLNNYYFYNKSQVDAYTSNLNHLRATSAEIALKKATQALPQTMNPMPGAEGQSVAFMEVEIGQAHWITDVVIDLCRQHTNPGRSFDDGTFTGHSSGAQWLGMEQGGTVFTCDITTDYSDVAKQYWSDANIPYRQMSRDEWEQADPRALLTFNGIIYVILPLDAQNYGGSRQMLNKLTTDPSARATFDYGFIDGAKINYDFCYEKGLEMLRPGGKLMLDNMLWSGRVTIEDAHDANTDALRVLNEKISNDQRVQAIFMNPDDGTWIVRKPGFVRNKATSVAL